MVDVSLFRFCEDRHSGLFRGGNMSNIFYSFEECQRPRRDGLWYASASEVVPRLPSINTAKSDLSRCFNKTELARRRVENRHGDRTRRLGHSCAGVRRDDKITPRNASVNGIPAGARSVRAPASELRPSETTCPWPSRRAISAPPFSMFEVDVIRTRTSSSPRCARNNAGNAMRIALMRSVR